MSAGNPLGRAADIKGRSAGSIGRAAGQQDVLVDSSGLYTLFGSARLYSGFHVSIRNRATVLDACIARRAILN